MPIPSTQTVFFVAIVAIVLIIVIAVRRGRAEPKARARLQYTAPAPRVRPTSGLDLQPLTTGARARYREEWARAQALFIDDPRESLAIGERILLDVLRDRGYPTASPDQIDADLGASSPRLVGRYRSVQETVARNNASTEDLRQALVQYRTVLDEMLGSDASPRVS